MQKECAKIRYKSIRFYFLKNPLVQLDQTSEYEIVYTYFKNS